MSSQRILHPAAGVESGHTQPHFTVKKIRSHLRKNNFPYQWRTPLDRNSTVSTSSITQKACPHTWRCPQHLEPQPPFCEFKSYISRQSKHYCWSCPAVLKKWQLWEKQSTCKLKFKPISSFIKPMYQKGTGDNPKHKSIGSNSSGTILLTRSLSNGWMLHMTRYDEKMCMSAN